MNSINFVYDMSSDFSDSVSPNTHSFFDKLVQNRNKISQALQNQGAVLIRQTPLLGLEDFKKAVLTLDRSVVEYTGAKVRRNLHDNVVYSPTSTPPHRINFLHHELAYQRTIPSRLAFMCHKPAPHGGESLLGDSRELYRQIKPEIRSEIESRKLLFRRVQLNRTKLQNFLSQHSDLFALMPSWQGNWETNDAKAAEEKALAQGLDVEWTKEKHMILKCQISSTRLHPQTKEPLWVNNAHLFQLHKKVYGPALTHLFKIYFKITGHPMTTCVFGDGKPIPSHYVDEILRATFATQKILPLNERDLIFINNETIAHGRLPFRGKRQLYFAAYR